MITSAEMHNLEIKPEEFRKGLFRFVLFERALSKYSKTSLIKD
jgi:hypothetical protein